MLKGAPDFCTVYVISKSGKISSTRSAARLAPFVHPLRHQFTQNGNVKSNSFEDFNVPPRGMQTLEAKFSIQLISLCKANYDMFRIGSISGIPKPVSDMPMSNLHSDTFNMK